MSTTTLETIAPDHATSALHLSSQTEDAQLRWLVASPYSESAHLLDLDTLDVQSRLFAIALTHLQLATADYACVAYEDVFDFGLLMEKLQELAREHVVTWQRQDFYVVEFRSTLKASLDNGRLSFLDKESHKEAVASGGLLKYWFGTPNSAQQNLATCTRAEQIYYTHANL
jgi:hypothetical protein